MRLPLIVLATAALLPLAAIAQTPKPDQALSIPEQEDLRFEESIRNFGFVSGAAYRCLPEASTSMSLGKTKCASYIEDFRATMKFRARGQ